LLAKNDSYGKDSRHLQPEAPAVCTDHNTATVSRTSSGAALCTKRQRLTRQAHLDNTAVHATSGGPASRTRRRRSAQSADPDDNATVPGTVGGPSSKVKRRRLT